jgi:hypothetical protein
MVHTIPPTDSLMCRLGSSSSWQAAHWIARIRAQLQCFLRSGSSLGKRHSYLGLPTSTSTPRPFKPGSSRGSGVQKPCAFVLLCCLVALAVLRTLGIRRLTPVGRVDALNKACIESVFTSGAHMYGCDATLLSLCRTVKSCYKCKFHHSFRCLSAREHRRAHAWTPEPAKETC